MAYYSNPNEEEQQEQEQGMNGPVSLGSGSGSSSSGGSAIPTGNMNSAAPKPASSGAKAGFAQYAKANTGSAQNRLNQSVGQNVQSQAKQATNAINQATTSFGQKVEAGSLKDRGQAVADVGNVVNAARNVTAAPVAAEAGKTAVNTQTIKSGQEAPAPQNTGIVPPAQQAPSALTQQQQDRFKEVINARYQGPESLRQAGLYQLASGKVQNAQTALDRTKSAGGREDLLKSMYQNRGDYTTGLNKLDSALLNANQQGVQNLQNIAQTQGNINQKLDQAQIGSSNLAQNRTGEIANIQEQARNTFTTGKQAEEAATEERLANVVKDWEKLPEYFRDIIRNQASTSTAINNDKIAQLKASPEYLKAQQDLAAAQGKTKYIITPTGKKLALNNPSLKNAQAKMAALNRQITDIQNNKGIVGLSPEEAAILGIQSGEGLYNLGADAIKSAQADKERLISRDEQARQSVLSQLAGLDLQNRLDTNLKYNNADKAGTQTASDALDLAATRENLNAAEKNFTDWAKATNLTAKGEKKNKTSGKTYYATEKANLGNLLSKAGYDLTPEARENLGNAELLDRLGSVTSTDVTGDPTGVGAGVGGYLSDWGQVGNSGGSVPMAALDMYGNMTGAGLITNALGLGGVGNAVSSVFGGGANSKESKNKAKEVARRRLNTKVKNAMEASGFDNRFAIADNDTTNQRLAGLQQLLANLDKTNK